MVEVGLMIYENSIVTARDAEVMEVLKVLSHIRSNHGRILEAEQTIPKGY